MKYKALKAKNKETGEIYQVIAMNDFFGKHEYGYRVGVGPVITEKEFNQLYEEIK